MKRRAPARGLATKAFVKSAIKRATRKDWRVVLSSLSCEQVYTPVPEQCYGQFNKEFISTGTVQDFNDDVTVRMMKGHLWFRPDFQSFDETRPILFRAGSYVTTTPDQGIPTIYSPAFDGDLSDAPWLHLEDHLWWPKQWAQNTRPSDTDGSVTMDGTLGVAGCDPAAFVPGTTGVYTCPEPAPAFTEEAYPYVVDPQRFVPKGIRLRENQSIMFSIIWMTLASGGAAPPDAPAMGFFGSIRALFEY